MKVRYEGSVGLRLVPGGVWKPGQEGEIADELWPEYRRLGFVKVRAGKKQEVTDAASTPE